MSGIETETEPVVGNESPTQLRGRERSLANLRPPFKKGEVANPAGRPVGARNRLSEAFLEDLEADWRENGASTIVKARQKDPIGYLKVIAGLCPPKTTIEVLEKRITELSIGELRVLEAQLVTATIVPPEE